VRNPAAVHESAYGTNRKSAHVRCDVGFRGDKQTCYAKRRETGKE
jgi:hypothetical protein